MSSGRIPSVEGGIQPTIVDAKGDLIVATAADTVSRLAVGTNNHVLTADSSTATGLKWATPAAGGKVLQVVQGTTTTSTNITSATYTDTTLSASITPSSTNSKVLVMVTQECYVGSSTDQGGGVLRLVRDSTNIWDPSGDTVVWIKTSASTPRHGAMFSLAYLDSPSTTSSTTYKTQAKVQSATNSMFVQVNGQATSTITLLEIGA